MIDGSRLRPSMRAVKKKETSSPIYIYIYTPRPAVSSPKHLSVSHWYQEIFHGMTRGQDNGGGRRYRRSRYTHRCRSRRASALRGRRRGEGGEVRVAAFKEYKETYICARVYTYVRGRASLSIGPRRDFSSPLYDATCTTRWSETRFGREGFSRSVLWPNLPSSLLLLVFSRSRELWINIADRREIFRMFC